MLIVDKLKGNLYTRIKKHMTKKMYHLYYRENREASQSKEEYEANLLRAYRHLDALNQCKSGWHSNHQHCEWWYRCEIPIRGNLTNRQHIYNIHRVDKRSKEPLILHNILRVSRYYR